MWPFKKRQRLEPVVYASGRTPHDYACESCGVGGVKLWRAYQSFQPELHCVDCACKRYGCECDLPLCDQLSWHIPAVPTEDDGPRGYWSYTSVPDGGVEWWKQLPLRADSPVTGYEPISEAERDRRAQAMWNRRRGAVTKTNTEGRES